MEIFFGNKNQNIIDGKFLTQIHSNKFIVVESQSQDTNSVEADALVTTISGVKLSVKTADCVPILLHSQSVVAAVHAGWRGAYIGIIQNTVKTMKELGADEIVAHIGPCIRQESYEVDKEFYEKFITQNIENKRFFTNLHFNLPSYCKDILNKVGVVKIIDEESDTFKNPDKFYSYRYYTKNGLKLENHMRQISSIKL